jgi:hypothetical protein
MCLRVKATVMAMACHMCGSTVATEDGSSPDSTDGFVCADCGELTCTDCKSIGVARSTSHCKRCRG